MSAEDFRINAFVRQTLSRNWVDLQTLNFGATGRIVYFHGRFQKVQPPPDPNEEPWEAAARRNPAEDLNILQIVEKRIRAEPMVVDVVFRLENFRKLGGKWTVQGA